jgi:O-antigen/teichoic acid export membrane protein
MIRQFSLLLSSQAILALVGVATVPVLFRNLGAELYGEYSTYLLLVGMLVHLDFTRPLLIREMAGGVVPPHRDALASLSLLNTLLLTAAAVVSGLLLLGPAAALAGGLTLLCNGLSMPRYAWLVGADRIGATGVVRNTLWSAALAGAAAASFFTSSEHAWLWGFAAANAATLVVYGRLVARAGAAAHPPPVAWRGAIAPYGRNARDLALFGAAMLVLHAADRFLLKPFASEQDFGAYMGAADLVLKANILSLAFGNTLYPVLARRVRDDGAAAADRWFGRVLTRIAGFGGVAALAGLVLLAPVARLLLGPDAVPSLPLIPVFVAGVYLQLFGFVIAPWLRAHGAFAAQRRAYVAGASLMLVGGPILIPAFGLTGAIGTWFLGRAGDALLLGMAMRRLGQEAYPVRFRRLHMLMLVTLTVAAWALFLWEVR